MEGTIARTFNRSIRNALPIVVIFFMSGTAHFIVPEWFDRIMPPWVPNARFATYASGVAELAGAIGLLIPATRMAAKWGLIALLIAVFPANIHMLNMARASSNSSAAHTWYVAALWLRLPVQAGLVWVVARIKTTTTQTANTNR